MIYIVGAAAVDLIACKKRFLKGTSNPSDIRMSPGGVGYRIFYYINSPKRLITAIGSDIHADWLENKLSKEHEIIMKRIPGQKTALYMAFMQGGELKYAASDMKVIEQGLCFSLVKECMGETGPRDFLVLEANLSRILVKTLLDHYTDRIRCVFESVSVEKFTRHIENLHDLYLLSANNDEFESLQSAKKSKTLHDAFVLNFMKQRKIKHVLVSRGKDGVSLYSQDKNRKDFKPGRLIRSGNTTGAGDRLLSASLELLYNNVRIEEAVPAAMRIVEQALEEGNL